jgi:hypothetical protein
VVFATDEMPQLNEVLAPLELELNHDELQRYLGYCGVQAKHKILSEELERELQRGLSLLEPKGIYSIYSVQGRSARELELGHATLQGQVATFLERAEGIAVFVVTVGQGITDCSRSAIDAGDPLGAWTLDAVGSWGAEAAAEALAAHLRRRFPAAGTLSARYSPGYCGMHLRQQQVLFDLVDAGSIGVTLLASMLMQPTKSVSGVIGIAPSATFAAASSSCERCSDVDCSMRR